MRRDTDTDTDYVTYTDYGVKLGECSACGDHYDTTDFRLWAAYDGMARCTSCQDAYDNCERCGCTYHKEGFCKCQLCVSCDEILDGSDGELDDLCGNCAAHLRCEDCGDWINDAGDDGPSQCLLCRKQAAGSAAVAATGQVRLQLILGGKGRKRDSGQHCAGCHAALDDHESNDGLCGKCADRYQAWCEGPKRDS